MFKVALQDSCRIEMGVDMYRSLLAVLIAVSAVHSAPQDHNSEITYVKIQPLNGDAPKAQPSSRESRIEILPLSIRGGNLASDRGANSTNGSQPSKSDNQSTTTSSSQESTAIVEEIINPAIEALNASIINKLNRIDSEDPNRTGKSENIVRNRPENTSQDRTIRSDTSPSYETTETTELATETERVHITPQTTAIESRTRAPSRKFISKLSYFKKSTDFSRSDVNLVERGPKKRFRSKCRCEKIWNCPKLQISVPRCPNEYFLCCF